MPEFVLAMAGLLREGMCEIGGGKIDRTWRLN